MPLHRTWEVLGGATDYRNGCRLGWLVVLRSRWWGPGPPALWEMFEDRGEEVSGCHLSCNVQPDIALKIIPYNVQFAARNGGFHSINWIPEECNWQNWAEIPLIKLRILQTLLLLTSCELVLVVADVTLTFNLGPIRTEPFFGEASDWSASVDLAASQTERVHNLSR